MAKRSGLKDDQVTLHFTAVAYLRGRYTSSNEALLEKATDKMVTAKRLWVPAIDGQPRFQISTSIAERVVNQLENSPEWTPYLDSEGMTMFDVCPPFRPYAPKAIEIPELSELNQKRLFELLVSNEIFGVSYGGGVYGGVLVPSSLITEVLGVAIEGDAYDLEGLRKDLKNKWTSTAIRRILRWADLLREKKYFRNDDEKRNTLIRRFCPQLTQARVDADNKEHEWMQSLLGDGKRKCQYFVQDGEAVCLAPFWQWSKFIKLDSHGRILPNRADGTVWYGN